MSTGKVIILLPRLFLQAKKWCAAPLPYNGHLKRWLKWRRSAINDASLHGRIEAASGQWTSCLSFASANLSWPIKTRWVTWHGSLVVLEEFAGPRAHDVHVRSWPEERGGALPLFLRCQPYLRQISQAHSVRLRHTKSSSTQADAWWFVQILLCMDLCLWSQ